MMKVYKTPSKDVQKIILTNVTYKEVIEGLNGYFASEPRNDYITVKMESDKQNFALYEAEALADILISWLRTEHGIFYYPGMEAKYAKMERIPHDTCDNDSIDGFAKAVEARAEYIESLSRNAERETRKAVNDQLKKDTDYVADVLSTILEALGISKSNTVHLDIFGLKTKAIKRASLIKSEHDRYLEQLGKAAADYQALSEENQKLKNAEKSDINKLIREYCTEHGIVAPSRYLSDEACIEYLFSVSVAILQDLYRDIFKRQPDGLSAKDIATKILDRMLTTEDLLHKSVDSVNEECKATGRLMVADYEKDLLKFIYKEYKDQIHRDEGVIAYNPSSVRNTITKIISDYASCRYAMDTLETQIKSIYDKYKTNFTVDDYVLNGDPTSSFMLSGINSWISSPAASRGKTRAEIENYKLKLKDYILKGIKKHGYRYDGLETKSIEEIVDWIITMATLDRSNIALRDIYTTVASPVERRRYNIDDCDGATASHMKDYILRRFEGLRANTEYCLKKMSELDGRQKDLKILEEQQEWLVKQNSELATKVSAKDDEISRLKDLINAMNEEVKDM